MQIFGSDFQASQFCSKTSSRLTRWKYTFVVKSPVASSNT